jgi:hypothetical protein
MPKLEYLKKEDLVDYEIYKCDIEGEIKAAVWVKEKKQFDVVELIPRFTFPGEFFTGCNLFKHCDDNGPVKPLKRWHS